MAEKKITKREKFEMVLKAVEGNEMLTEFINHEIELLTKKSGSGSAKKNEEKERFFDLIRDVLAEATDVNGMPCAEILADERISGFPWKDGKVPTSSSRLTSALTAMGEPTEKYPDRLGDVKRTVVKKTPYFSLA